jgi:hypothetical protein
MILDVLRVRSSLVTALLTALLAVLALPGAAQQPPAGARPLSAYELYLLYRETIWPWASGAAHFFDEGRRFIAWTADETGVSHAAGRYELTDRGSMCLVGRWVGLHYPSGRRYAVRSRTCFRHVTDGATVYQRRATGGAWSILASPDAEEPVLVASDEGEVAARIAEIEETLEMLRNARPAAAWRLLELYGDRSWHWQPGGVRFFAEDRRFLAYRDDESEQTIGEGRFMLTNDGRMCLLGEWKGVTLPDGERYTASPRICFRHLENSRGLFRLRPDSAEWDLVSSRTDPDVDPSLVAGDTVSSRVERLRRRLSP